MSRARTILLGAAEACAIASSPITRLIRFLTGRCTHCGAHDWRARHDGWTVPTPVCGKCGEEG